MTTHAVDATKYPNLAASTKSIELLDACYQGFTYGLQNAATMKDAPPPSSSWSFEQAELIKACTYGGQFTGNATVTKKWTGDQQEFYQQEYGTAVAKGLEDMLAKRKADSNYTPARTWDTDVKDTLQTIYVTAYYVNQNATVETGVLEEDSSGSKMSSGTKRALIVAGVGVVGTGLVMAGLHFMGKKPLANPFGARYRLDDGPEEFSLESFLSDNEELDSEIVDEIKKMSAGSSLTFGGGAQPVWTITRVR